MPTIIEFASAPIVILALVSGALVYPALGRPGELRAGHLVAVL